MATSKAKRDRDIQKWVGEMAECYGEKFLKSISAVDEADLRAMPHPKIPKSDLTAFDYISWMCGKGWHKKAKAVFAELTTTTN